MFGSNTFFVWCTVSLAVLDFWTSIRRERRNIKISLKVLPNIVSPAATIPEKDFFFFFFEFHVFSSTCFIIFHWLLHLNYIYIYLLEYTRLRNISTSLFLLGVPWKQFQFFTHVQVSSNRNWVMRWRWV